MKKIKIELSVSSKAYEVLQSYIRGTLEVIGLEVRGKWLTATLSNGIRFSVLNKT